MEGRPDFCAVERWRWQQPRAGGVKARETLPMPNDDRPSLLCERVAARLVS